VRMGGQDSTGPRPVLYARRRMRRLALTLLGPVISVAAVVLAVRSVDLSDVAFKIANAQLPLLIPAVLLIAVGITLRSWRWQRLLPPDAVGGVPIHRIVPVLLVGYLGNTVLPARLGEAIRAFLLARREGLSSFEILGTALLERIIDLAVLALMAALAAITLGVPAWIVQLTVLAGVGGVGLVAALTFVGIGPVVRGLGRLMRHMPLAERGLAPLDRLGQGMGRRAVSQVLQASALSIPIWLTDTAICLFVAAALGIGIPPGGALLVIAIGALGTSVPSAPAYVGTFELAASAAGRAVGLDPASALSLAVVVHAVSLVPVAVAGAVSLVAIRAGNLVDLAGEARKERARPPSAG